jgi:predicted nucleotidyltransferase
MATDELIRLARTLADWVEAAPNFTIYLFGSRVRGDHRPDSDVDVIVDFGKPTMEEVLWWQGVNEDLFRSINALLPGPIGILVNNVEMTNDVKRAEVVHRDRQVVCVRTKPKPAFETH